jgi:hypothetical protein
MGSLGLIVFIFIFYFFILFYFILFYLFIYFFLMGLIVDSPYKYAAVLGGATRSANLLRDGGKF